MFIAGTSSAYYSSYKDAITSILLLLISASILYCEILLRTVWGGSI